MWSSQSTKALMMKCVQAFKWMRASVCKYLMSCAWKQYNHSRIRINRVKIQLHDVRDTLNFLPSHMRYPAFRIPHSHTLNALSRMVLVNLNQRSIKSIIRLFNVGWLQSPFHSRFPIYILVLSSAHAPHWNRDSPSFYDLFLLHSRVISSFSKVFSPCSSSNKISWQIHFYDVWFRSGFFFSTLME